MSAPAARTRPDRASGAPAPSWRTRLHEVIFETDTSAGRAFDIALLLTIVLSVAVAMLESVEPIRERYGAALYAAEWVFTILFTAEYILRLASVRRPALYAVSFFGLVDLLAVIPTYLSLFFPGAQSLIVIRALRLLRIFRIFKLGRHLEQGQMIAAALRNSREKITVFLVAVLSSVLVVGALMYLVEGEENGFTSIPRSVYWAIVTMTTVGYGDIAPQTPAGQVLACALMITGYGIIAVPTGIVTAEMIRTSRTAAVSTAACPACGAEGHRPDAGFCFRCGARL